MTTPQEALIYTMVMMSAADRDMTDSELRSIGDIVNILPVFENFDPNRIPEIANACAELVSRDDGLDRIMDLMADSLPERLRETAYVCACDVAAADRMVSQEELRLLEMMRDRLDIDRLTAAAIERAARARHARL